MKLITFNALSSRYVSYNIGACKNEKPISEKDERIRALVTYNMLKKSDADIICLQETSSQLYEFIKRWDDYALFENKNKEVLVLINKKVMVDGKQGEIIHHNNEFQKILSKRFVMVSMKLCERNNKSKCEECIIISVHVPTFKNHRELTINFIQNEIINKNYEKNIILAGDMNTFKNIFSGNIQSILPIEFKKANATSFKLGVCQEDKFVLRKDHRHNFVDDIYGSKKILRDTIKVASSFDEKFNLIYDDDENKFNRQAGPFCDPEIYNSTGKCYMYREEPRYSLLLIESVGQNTKPWPSDHALLELKFKFVEERFKGSM